MTENQTIKYQEQMQQQKFTGLLITIYAGIMAFLAVFVLVLSRVYILKQNQRMLTGGISALQDPMSTMHLMKAFRGSQAIFHSYDLGIMVLSCFALVIILAIGFSCNAYAETKIKLKETTMKKDSLAQDRLSQFMGLDMGDYFKQLVTLNIDNLDSYYVLVKVHTDNSFRVALMVGIAGFILLGSGVIMSFMGADHVKPAFLTGVSGVLVEFISGIQFKIYNTTVQQLKEYHASLIDVQNILLSFKLVDSVNDPVKRNEMVSQLVNFLVGPDQ